LYSNKTEQKSGLSRHYRQIGIKAVAAATRKETAPHLEQAARRHKKEDIMSEASRIVESLDKTQETSAETIQGVQEGLTSALENVRDLNVKLIDMARANTDAAFDFAREAAEAKAPSDLVQAWTTRRH
jgi:DNA-directed RNA polymerase subunit F